jgi:hypothetical protein
VDCSCAELRNVSLALLDYVMPSTVRSCGTHRVREGGVRVETLNWSSDALGYGGDAVRSTAETGNLLCSAVDDVLRLRYLRTTLCQQF